MRSFFRPVTFLLLLLPILTACGREEAAAQLGSGELRWNSFPIEIQAEEAITDDLDSREDLLAAISFWEHRVEGRALFRLDARGWDSSRVPYVGNPETPDRIFANVIFFKNPWPFASSVAGKTVVRATNNQIEAGLIFLNGEKNLCKGDCTAATSQRKLIAHELGHLLGFAHSSDRGDIMYPEILPTDLLESASVNEALLLKLTN
ncbi:MAG: matrixin family metalloprotease [Proteobacteria bacterium]|nr:MAG: matrixin family metalloprotease [Pseudomonadota bacterium]